MKKKKDLRIKNEESARYSKGAAQDGKRLQHDAFQQVRILGRQGRQ